METVTSDLGKFGNRERGMAEDLLREWNNGNLPDEFIDDEVSIAMNMNSGCVFLTNSEYQTAMMNGDNLEMWYNCPYCGHEGFKEDMWHVWEAEECEEYLEDIGVIESS